MISLKSFILILGVIRISYATKETVPEPEPEIENVKVPIEETEEVPGAPEEVLETVPEPEPEIEDVKVPIEETEEVPETPVEVQEGPGEEPVEAPVETPEEAPVETPEEEPEEAPVETPEEEPELVVDAQPNPADRDCSIYYRNYQWALQDCVCRPLQNECLMKIENANRVNDGSTPFVPVTKELCQSFIPHTCSKGIPVLAQFPIPAPCGCNRKPGSIATQRFDSLCDLLKYSAENTKPFLSYSYIPRRGNGRRNYPKEG